MNNKIKIFIMAGEASGDVLGASVMRSFGNQAEFRGIGGMNMTSAGLKSIFPMADLSVMGLSAVIARIWTLLRRIRQAADAIKKWNPDVVLSIDSPGFAKAVAKKIGKGNGAKLYHFVAPQVWAWRAGRAKKFAKLFDRLYCFFDFEVPYFTKFGLPTIPVGHPIADGEIRNFIGRKRDNKMIALLPGSRPAEVAAHMPLLGAVAENFPGYKIMVPVADPVRAQVVAAAKSWNAKPIFAASQNRYSVFADAALAVVASGTASAELAVLHTPAVVVYKTSALTYWGFRLVSKIKFVSLVNIIMGRKIYPEFLQHNATANNVIMSAHKILDDDAVREKMISELESADKIWSLGGLPASDILRDDLIKSL
ncbi:MAG: lipid-A-disaccharide synthase [Rickettsiales bacterium]|jgi:lipid-A-disaccharide synthase|nr:lipid-A-disaccharide synthase [Rickettsiales bacterium]